MPERGRFEDDSVMMTRTSHGLEASLPPLAGGRGKEREGREGERPDGGQGARGGGGGEEARRGNGKCSFFQGIILESSSQSSSNHP